ARSHAVGGRPAGRRRRRLRGAPLRRAASAGAVDEPPRRGPPARRHRCAAAERHHGLGCDRLLPRHRDPARLGAGPHEHPRAFVGTGPRDAADGPAAGGGRRCAAVRLRPAGPAGRAGLRHHRPAAPLLGVGSGRREHLRGHAVPRPHRRVGPASGRHPVRGRRSHARRQPVDDLPAGHRPQRRTLDHHRRPAVLGEGTGRVRGHRHLRGQPPGPDADDAARRLPRPRVRPGCRHRPLPGADRRVAGRPRPAPRPLAGGL
ncbi:MAG: Molybdenum ABC transporter permease protein ModB, partial [uncultured Acidimicrobiales bacterium]